MIKVGIPLPLPSYVKGCINASFVFVARLIASYTRLNAIVFSGYQTKVGPKAFDHRFINKTGAKDNEIPAATEGNSIYCITVQHCPFIRFFLCTMELFISL